MDLVVIAAFGGLLLILLILAVGALLFLRRRSDSKQAAAKNKSKTTKQKPKRRLKKASAQAPVQKRASTNNKSAPAQPVEASPAPVAAAPPASAPVLPPAHPAPLEEGKAPPGDKIRVLIVDDNAGTRENVSRLLYFEDDLEVVGQGMDGRQGLEMAVEMKPHIVLMDINMPDMDGITATEKMGLQAPFSQVIIMSVQADQHYMRQAMAAGARDFQPKPFTSEELVGCIRRVYQLGVPMYQQFEAAQQAQTIQKKVKPQTKQGETTQAPVIVVYSPKGGVGTSAIAGNLAVALQQEIGDVVLVDGAFQFGDIMVHLNTRSPRTIVDLVHESGVEVDLLPDILMPHTSGLKLLLAPSKPELADTVTPDMISSVINELKTQSRVVVVDTACKLTDETLTILDHADYILAVTVPELPSIKNTKQFLDLADELDFNLNRLKVVINKANEMGAVPPDKVAKVLKLDHTYNIPQDPRMAATLRKGISVCLQDAGAPSAAAITGMAQQVWQQLEEDELVTVEETA